MKYEEKFSNSEIQKIIEEGLVYMCACPAQVAESVRTVRDLYRYQLNCIYTKGDEDQVHKTIAEHAILAHAQLEQCMEEILRLENWDRKTLTMPEGLRHKQLQAIMA